MSPAPTFRFIQLPDGLTKREEEYCIQLTKDLTPKHGYQEACKIAEDLAENFIAARQASQKGPAINLIVTALPMGITHFSFDSARGKMQVTLSDEIHDADLNILKTVLKPNQVEVSDDRKTISLHWS